MAALSLVLTMALSACSIGSDSSDDPPQDELFQVSTIASLSAGAYAGLIDFNDVLDHGDFGLGTFDALDGELIVLDGKAYRVPADGIPQEVDGSVTTPFVAVTTWDADEIDGFFRPNDLRRLRNSDRWVARKH